MESSDALRAFRYSFYECLHRRADALFELTDAILTADAVPSPVHLSLEASHRRGWGSLYAALRRGRIDSEALRELLARHPLAGSETPVYAVDVSVWDRSDAETSPERGYYYHPSRHSAGQPIVAGWAYQFIAELNFVRESWTAPVDALRVHPMQDANVVAVEQVKGLLVRRGKEEAVPLFVFDAGYDPVKLQRGLEGWPCRILVRLRAGRCFYADPSFAGPPGPVGRVVTDRRWIARIRAPGPSPPPSAHARTPATGRCACAPGRGCTRRFRPTPAAAAADQGRSCAGRWCWWRWSGYPTARGGASRGSCGCGGTVRENPISASSGALTSDASTWSTPSAFSSRLLGGLPLGCATPSRLIGGRGSCSPPSRNCACPARA